jgi:hypothetical protein
MATTGLKKLVKVGRCNTKFYHACANQKQKHNKIIVIMDERGRIWDMHEGTGQAFIDYNGGLFTAGRTWKVEKCLRLITPSVTP